MMMGRKRDKLNHSSLSVCSLAVIEIDIEGSTSTSSGQIAWRFILKLVLPAMQQDEIDFLC